MDVLCLALAVHPDEYQGRIDQSTYLSAEIPSSPVPPSFLPRLGSCNQQVNKRRDDPGTSWQSTDRTLQSADAFTTKALIQTLSMLGLWRS